MSRLRIRRGVIGSSSFVEDPGDPGELLKWAPPTLVSPTTINISNSNRSYGEISNPMSLTTDYILNFTEKITAGTVQWFGGRNVRCIGGEIDFDAKVKACGSFVNNDVIGWQIGSVAQTFHLEGQYIHGLGMAQGIVFWATANVYTTRLQIQNCRIASLEKVAANGSHTDAIQLYAGPDRLMLYKNTLESRGPCLQLQTYDLAADNMPVPTLNHFEKLHCTQRTQTENCPDPPPYHEAYALWKGLQGASGGQTYWPSYVKDCYINCADTADEGTYDYAAWADGFSGGSNDPHWGGWSAPGTGPWAGKITGEAWNYGSPAQDFVPLGLAGIGYVSPGYV